MKVFKGAHEGPVYVARFDKNGEYILSAGSDATIFLWNANSNDTEPIRDYIGASKEIYDLDIHPEMTTFAIGGADRTVIIFDVSSGKLLRKLAGHYHRINCVSYSQDPPGSLLLSGSYDSKVRIWDLKSHNSRLPIMILDDAKDSIVALSSIDTNIMTASVDGTIRIYDVRRGKLASYNLGHPISDAKFTMDANCVLASAFSMLTNDVCPSGQGWLYLVDREGENQSIILNRYGPLSNKNNYKIPIEFADSESKVMCGDELGNIWSWDFVHQTLLHKWSINAGTSTSTKQSPITSIKTNDKSRSFLVTSLDGRIILFKYAQ